MTPGTELDIGEGGDAVASEADLRYEEHLGHLAVEIVEVVGHEADGIGEVDGRRGIAADRARQGEWSDGQGERSSAEHAVQRLRLESHLEGLAHVLPASLPRWCSTHRPTGSSPPARCHA